MLYAACIKCEYCTSRASIKFTSQIIHFQFRFDGKSVQKAKSTVFKHRSIYQLTTYHGQPLTTGSSEPEHAKTEIMSIETGEWESGPDYPFYSM